MLRSLAVRAGLLCLVMTGLAAAQVKVGIVNVQDAILKTAEIKKASDELAAKYKSRQDALVKLQQDLQSISTQLGNAKITPQAAADLQAQGQRKERDLQRLQQDLQTDVDADRNDILTKAGAKMKAVVEKLAAEKGLDMVVDVSQTIYFKPALEITNDVIAAYDKANPVKK